jgi:hypothetical protein
MKATLTITAAVTLLFVLLLCRAFDSTQAATKASVADQEAQIAAIIGK